MWKLCISDTASQAALVVKNLPGNAGEMQVQSLSQEDPLEEGTATHSSILAWRIPWTEEPGGLQSITVTKSWTQMKWLSMHAHMKSVKYAVTSCLKNQCTYFDKKNSLRIKNANHDLSFQEL